MRWIAEVGYVFRERQEGQSKVTWRVYVDYLRHLVRLRLSALSTLRFMRFALVGASGVVVDMALLFLLSDPRSLGLGLTRSKIVAAELAIINNFLWNDAWTFRDLVGARRGPRHKLRRLLKFNAVCGIGLVLNVVLLNIQFNVLHINRYVANLIAIGVVTVVELLAEPAAQLARQRRQPIAARRACCRGYRLQYWMPRSTFVGENTLLTSMKQPLSRTIPSSFACPSWMYSLWLTATMSASRFVYSSSWLSVTPYSCFASAGLPRLSWISGVDAELRAARSRMSGTLLLRRSLHVLLERQPEDADARALHRNVLRRSASSPAAARRTGRRCC